jgi:hypothetical protein
MLLANAEITTSRSLHFGHAITTSSIGFPTGLTLRNGYALTYCTDSIQLETICR